MKNEREAGGGGVRKVYEKHLNHSLMKNARYLWKVLLGKMMKEKKATMS